MAGRPGSTFGKRQREQKLIERRQEKSARKEQRKVDKQNGILVSSDEDGDENIFAPDATLDSAEDDETNEEHSAIKPAR